MGIKDWFKLFGAAIAKPMPPSEFKGKAIGIDVSVEIYRGSLGMKNINTLTDDNGIPTVLLNTLLCNVVKYKKLGITGLIYIFDNPVATTLKIAENERRSALKKKADVKVKKAKINGDTKTQHRQEKRAFRVTDDMIADVKKLLTFLGVAWTVAPPDYEAEHLGAQLSIDGVIDYFSTTDSDLIVYGGKAMIRKNPTTKKLERFSLMDVMVEFNLTLPQLVHLGVVMGSDFAPKTAGIGFKSYLKKGLDVVLTEVQQAAKEKLLSECPYKVEDINKSDIDISGLVSWLVDEKGFGRERVEKLLSVFI
jgi:hypothetical protein